MKKSVKDFSYLASANLILKVLGVVAIAIYTRLLLKEELAIVPIHALLGRLSMVMFSLGVLPCLVKIVPSLRSKNEYARIYSLIRTCLIIVAPGVFLFSVVCFVFADELSVFIFDREVYTDELRILSFGIFFSGMSQLFSYIYWSLSRFQQESKRMVVVGFIKLVSGIGLVYFLGVYGLIISLVISSFLNFAIYIYNLRKVIFRKTSLYSVSDLLKDSWPFYLESYLMYFRAEGDQLVVTGFLGAEALAIYYIARRPFELLRSFTQSLDRVLTTSLAELTDDKGQFSRRICNIVSLNAYILIPVVFLTIGLTPTLITLIAGSSYQESVIPAIGLLLTLLVQFNWNSTFGRTIFLLTPSKNRFTMTIIETGFLFVFLLVLGKFFGLEGIVIGRLMATFSAGVVAYLMVKSYLTLKINLTNLLIALGISVVMSLILLGGQYFFTNYLYLGLIGFASLIFFLLGIHLTISNDFYSKINNVSPIKIVDPITFVVKRLL